MTKDLLDKLKAPFLDDDVEWRVQRYFPSRKQAIVVPYITARAVQDRLNDVFLGDNVKWEDSYELCPYAKTNAKGETVHRMGMKCKLTITIGNQTELHEGVAPFTDIEDIKGGESDSLKRAALKIGIGRSLYDLKEQWVDCTLTKVSDNDMWGQYKDVDYYWQQPTIDVNGEITRKESVRRQKEEKKKKLHQMNIAELKSELKRGLGVLSEKDTNKYTPDLFIEKANMYFRPEQESLDFDKMIADCSNRDFLIDFINWIGREVSNG